VLPKRAVFLDRDGVIIETKVEFGRPIAIRKKNEIKMLGDATKGIKLLLNSGFELVIITNQPDVAKGITPIEHVNQIHKEISRLTGLKHFYICSHADSDSCECRKPKPGLLISASENLNLDLDNSFLIGDRWRDIASGQKAGCRCYFIDYGYNEAQPNPPFTRVHTLFEAATLICSEV
jgi:D-glycero-D-manno-heptose 1,7-bisphosphate phosphatase